MKKLPLSFFCGTDVVAIARQLVGCVLYSNFNGELTAGRIVETEAYKAFVDRACHAHAGRRTNRNEIMYARGGHAYVYICYGMHHLFNIVTNKKDIPEAVLIRALEPVAGLNIMLSRRNKLVYDHAITKGPGAMSVAMGFNSKLHSGLLMQQELIWITEGSLKPGEKLVCGPRIGVESAGEDALLPWRFFIERHPNVSAVKTGKPAVD